MTTIGGTLDVHIYDVARIEVLRGPQGTLYGASSEAGTIRIITNRPDPSGFSAALDAELNTVRHGGIGGALEGYVNAPLGDHAALRLVAWYQHDSGYIDNVAGTRHFLPNPPGGITINNIAPGAITTPINTKMIENKDQLDALLKNIPLGRMGTPEDVAGLALFLASDDGAYCTGSTFIIDGGLIRNYHEQ